MINLDDFVTDAQHFKWREVLYLPSWKIYHTPSDQEIQNLISLITKVDVIHDYFDAPFNVHCALRPSSVNCPGSLYHGKDYNHFVGGAAHSTHIVGLAIDFDVVGKSVDDVMIQAKAQLNNWQLSWEQNGSASGRNWCHAQDKQVDGIWKIFIP